MKTDPQLGLEVRDYLVSVGVETPLKKEEDRHNYDDTTKVDIITKLIFQVLDTFDLDLTDDSLVETPKRVADMYVKEMMSGLDYSKFPKMTVIENKINFDELVIVNNMKPTSVCEHHLVTIDQNITIGYIPNKKVVGLSKLARLAMFFSKRPQVQERLVLQIFHALKFLLDTEDVAVHISGVHYCMAGRGVREVGSSTITTKLGGRFMDESALRQEFLQNCTKHNDI